jgi:hypothetical protein
MDRKDEIKIILKHIKNDLKTYYGNYESLLEDKIVEYGILIKKYQNELNAISDEDAESILKDYKDAINYSRCCKSDSELLHTEVFNLANKLAINGYGNEAVKMHGICNGM